MQAGTLRHVIQVQAKTRTVDAVGGYTEVWATITSGTVWARIVPVGGLEQFRADQLQEIVTHKITIRYLSGVTVGHRVLFGSQTFDVKNVIDLEERGVTLILLCEERFS